MKTSGDKVSNCVSRLKVLAEESRLSILQDIMGEAKTVTQILENVHVEQSLLSHHLKKLRDAGLVTATRRGKSVVYATAPEISNKSDKQVIDLGCCKLTFPQKKKVRLDR